jgi:thymidine kinase
MKHARGIYLPIKLFVVAQDSSLFDIPENRRQVHCVLVDGIQEFYYYIVPFSAFYLKHICYLHSNKSEVQFLQPYHVEELRSITTKWNVPVICYGLRTDFRTQLFPGSKRLLELVKVIKLVMYLSL